MRVTAEPRRSKADPDLRLRTAAAAGRGLGMVGFFASVALGFAVYAALLVWAVLRVKEPAAGPKAA